MLIGHEYGCHEQCRARAAQAGFRSLVAQLSATGAQASKSLRRIDLTMRTPVTDWSGFVSCMCLRRVGPRSRIPIPPSRPMSRFARSSRWVRYAAIVTGFIAATACSNDATSILGPVSHGGDSVTVAPAPTHTDSTTGSLLSLIGSSFWVDPSSRARSTADSWRATRPSDAAQMDKLANAPSARWIGNWNTNVQADVNAASATMAASGAIPAFVAYNIPQRDCGGYSGGNLTAPAAHKTWIDAFASGLGNRRAVIVLEPDALAGMDCLSPADQHVRLDLLSYAVQQITAKDGVAVYIDAGNPHWKSAAVMADRLKSADVGRAQRHSLNVSNFYLTSDNAG